MIMLVFILLIIGVSAVAIVAVLGYWTSGAARLNKELTATARNLAVAESGLRKIANGLSGNPAIDAQNTLESVSNDLKELN